MEELKLFLVRKVEKADNSSYQELIIVQKTEKEVLEYVIKLFGQYSKNYNFQIMGSWEIKVGLRIHPFVCDLKKEGLMLTT